MSERRGRSLQHKHSGDHRAGEVCAEPGGSPGAPVWASGSPRSGIPQSGFRLTVRCTEEGSRPSSAEVAAVPAQPPALPSARLSPARRPHGAFPEKSDLSGKRCRGNPPPPLSGTARASLLPPTLASSRVSGRRTPTTATQRVRPAPGPPSSPGPQHHAPGGCPGPGVRRRAPRRHRLPGSAGASPTPPGAGDAVSHEPAACGVGCGPGQPGGVGRPSLGREWLVGGLLQGKPHLHGSPDTKPDPVWTSPPAVQLLPEAASEPASLGPRGAPSRGPLRPPSAPADRRGSLLGHPHPPPPKDVQAPR